MCKTPELFRYPERRESPPRAARNSGPPPILRPQTVSSTPHNPTTPDSDGDSAQRGTNELVGEVYDELRRIAQKAMNEERPGHTLQATALVNEIYVRLDASGRQWNSRAHFFAAAAEAIRRILIDHARSKSAAKRGGGRARIPMDDALAIAGPHGVDLLDLDDALRELGKMDSRMAQVVELRFFGGLEVGEVAEVLGFSKRTIEGDWGTARAWLRSRLTG
ncbi:MAG: sigma-70 family RNA polymerase sigma factor [Planctomycetes bacterium]|nr:sigma-70 family RNA polymerase sigma factor [Planctomycetota bacterium]MCP4839991.1 sigma-70 family RNA polymerase sigma factor [Planctomycetota bacterium]